MSPARFQTDGAVHDPHNLFYDNNNSYWSNFGGYNNARRQIVIHGGIVDMLFEQRSPIADKRQRRARLGADVLRLRLFLLCRLSSK